MEFIPSDLLFSYCETCPDSDSTSYASLEGSSEKLSEAFGGNLAAIPTVQPEELGHLIQKSTHQPICLFYSDKGE